MRFALMTAWQQPLSTFRIVKFVTTLAVIALMLVLWRSFNQEVRYSNIIEVEHSNLSTADDVYLDRLSFVRQFCEGSHPVNKISSPKDMIGMSYELGVYWCPVFKSGSSQWLKLFCSSRDSQHFSGLGFRNNVCNIQTLRKHGKKCRLPKQDCVNKHSIVFMVVRNPIDRFLSAFSNKWELANVNVFWKTYGSTILRRFRYVNQTKFANTDKLLQEASDIVKLKEGHLKKISNTVRMNINYTLSPTQWNLIRNLSNPYLNPPGPTFSELVRWVLEGGSNPHITPFYQYCAPCTLPYTILKLDNFPEEADYLLDKLGHHELQPQLHNQFQNSAAPWKTETCIIRHLRSLDSEDFRDIYRKLWETDCQLYQYPCHELYRKVEEMGPSRENFVLC